MQRFLVLIFFVASVLAQGAASAHHRPGPIRIAAILSVTGPAGYLGSPEKKALELEIERENAAGGVLAHPITLTVRDDESNARKAEAIARELANPGNFDLLIGGSTTDTSLAIAAVAQKAGVPFIALGASARIVEPRRSFVFKIPPTERMSIISVLADMRKRGLREISLVAESSGFGKAARQELRDFTHPQGLGFKNYGIRLAGVVMIRRDGSNIEPQMASLAAARNTGAILIVAAGDLAPLATRKAREAGLKAPLYQTHAAACPEFLRAAGPAAEGVRVTTPPLAIADQLAENDPVRAPVAAFVAQFKERYGDAPCPFAGYGRDAAAIATRAMLRLEDIGLWDVRAALEGIQGFVGVTGVYHLHPSDHLGLAPGSLRMSEVKGGRFVLVD